MPWAPPSHPTDLPSPGEALNAAFPPWVSFSDYPHHLAAPWCFQEDVANPPSSRPPILGGKEGFHDIDYWQGGAASSCHIGRDIGCSSALGDRAQPLRLSGTSLFRTQGCLLPSCLSKSHCCCPGNYLLYLDLDLGTKARKRCWQIPASCWAQSLFHLKAKCSVLPSSKGNGKQIQKNVFSKSPAPCIQLAWDFS